MAKKHKAPSAIAIPAEPDKSDKIHDYEIEEAASTLMRAEDIKKNKKLMPHVHKHLAKKVKSIKSVQDIRDAANDINEEDEGE